jgi:phosphoribosylformylglycinamidine synthase
MELKQPNNSVYLVGKTYPEMGSSTYYQNKGILGNNVPKVRLETAKTTMNLITEAIDKGLLRACHDLSDGGLAVAASEMAFGSGYGLNLDLRKVSKTKELVRNDFVLFSESNSRFLVEVTPKNKEPFETLMKDVAFAEVGTVTKEPVLSVTGLDGKQKINAELDELRKRWKRTLGA